MGQNQTKQGGVRHQNEVQNQLVPPCAGAAAAANGGVATNNDSKTTSASALPSACPVIGVDDKQTETKSSLGVYNVYNQRIDTSKVEEDHSSKSIWSLGWNYWKINDKNNMPLEPNQQVSFFLFALRPIL